MATMTKQSVIDAVAHETGESRANVKVLLQSILDVVTSKLGTGAPVQVSGFGTFEVRRRKKRLAQNPKTLERIEVPAKSVVKFRAGPWLKELVQSPDTLPKSEPPEVPTGIAAQVGELTMLPAPMVGAVAVAVIRTISTGIAAQARIELRDFGVFELGTKHRVVFKAGRLLAETVAQVVMDDAGGTGSNAVAGAKDAEFSLWIDPGGADSKDIAAVFSALSDLHRAAGGQGLVFSARGSSSYILAEDLQ